MNNVVMRSIFVVLFVVYSYSLRSLSASSWTYEHEAGKQGKFHNWHEWSYPKGSALKQNLLDDGTIRITSSGTAFAFSRQFALSNKRGYTIAFKCKCTVRGPFPITASVAFFDITVKEKYRYRLVWSKPRDEEFSDGTVGLLGRAGLVWQHRLPKTVDGYHIYWICGNKNGIRIWVDNLRSEAAIFYRGHPLKARGKSSVCFGDDNSNSGSTIFDIKWMRVNENRAIVPKANMKDLQQGVVLTEKERRRLKWKPWILDGKFVIGGWSVFRGNSYEDVLGKLKLYKSAGMNVACVVDEDGIKAGKELGLATLVMGQWGWRKGESYFERWYKLANSYPDVGYLLWDEPEEKYFPLLSKRMRRLNKTDPSRMVWINLLPQIAWGGSSYTYIRKVEKYLNVVQPRVLSYDFYATLIDGSDYPQFYSNMEIIRKLACEYEIPWWGFALVTKHLSYREPSESDLRWQVYSLLAHGAKGVWYFRYFYSHGFKHIGMLDKFGKPTHLYAYIKQINKEIRSMEPTIVRLKSTAIGHIGKPTPWSTMFHRNELIRSAEAKNAFVGVFVDDKGVEYVMLINKNHGPDVKVDDGIQRITVVLASDIKEVKRIGKSYPPSCWAFDLASHTLDVYLPAGTGALFQIK